MEIHIRIHFKDNPSIELKGELRYMVNEFGTLHVYIMNGIHTLPIIVASKDMWILVENMKEIDKYLVKPP